MSVLLLSAAFLLVAAEPPDPVAMVLDTKGTLMLERAGAKPGRLDVGDPVYAEDRLMAQDAGARLIFLEDGHCEQLKPKARVTVATKGCTPVDSVEPVKRKTPSPRQLDSLRDLARSGRGAVGVVRGTPPASPQVVTPLYGATVLTDRPKLTWRPVEKAAGYRVELWSGDGKRLIWRAKPAAAQLDYPPKETALRPGAAYLWRVRARSATDEDLGLVVDSEFATAGKMEAAELAALQPLAAGADTADWLQAALTYQEYGVYGEALALFEKLAAKQPDKPKFQEALAIYYERAGRTDEANKAREKAKRLRAELPAP
jgi:hypothetical protein